MPYKNMLTVLIAVVLSGCSTQLRQYKNVEDELSGIIKNSLKDNALKDTSDFNIHSLNILKIDTVTSSKLDSQFMARTSARLEYCNVMADLYQSMSKTNARIGALSKKIKRGALPDVSANDINSDVSEARMYKDSANYYGSLLDSLNKIMVSNNRFSDTLYQVKTFLKATEKKNNDSTVYFGTKYFYITKYKKVIDLSDLELRKLKDLNNHHF